MTKEPKNRREAGTPVRLPDGRYRIRYRVPAGPGGKLVYRQETLDAGLTRTEAKKIFAKRLDEAETLRMDRKNGRFIGDLTFSEIAERYLTERPKLRDSSRERAETQLRLYILPAIGTAHVATVGKRKRKLSAKQVTDYLESRWKDGKAGVNQSSVRREWATIRAILRWATAKEIIDENPVNTSAVNLWISEHLPDNNVRTDIFTPEEWRDFLACVHEDSLWSEYLTKRKETGVVRFSDAQGRKLGRGGRRPDSPASRRHREQVLACVPVLRMLLYTGSRLGEITSLTWGQVDRKRSEITIQQQKTDKPKVLPISSGMREILDAQPEGIGDALVFRHPAREDVAAQFHHREIQRAMKAMLRVAKLRNPELDLEERDLSPHSIRHTANTWMKECGFSYEIRSDVLGQSVQEINMDYSHASAQSLSEAVEAIWMVEHRGFPKRIVRLSWGENEAEAPGN